MRKVAPAALISFSAGSEKLLGRHMDSLASMPDLRALLSQTPNAFHGVVVPKLRDAGEVEKILGTIPAKCCADTPTSPAMPAWW
jgi:hypothetical protein